jgi:hypothetical protein
VAERKYIITAEWDDEWKIRKKLEELKLKGDKAERVRNEYARIWNKAEKESDCKWVERRILGKTAANSWLSNLTLAKALKI